MNPRIFNLFPLSSTVDNPGDRLNDHRMRKSNAEMNNCNGYVPSVTRLSVTRLSSQVVVVTRLSSPGCLVTRLSMDGLY
jgi:hypothetical protein